MPPKSQQPTTAEQQKFVIQWLSVLDNRLACFGGAGAKSAYGNKMVVKPATAYNSLAQAVNKKFPGTLWDGDSAKSRVRTMKTKFHNVFSLCGANCQEESAVWRLSEADKREGILTLSDKAQSMCPNWFSWLEWCGNDPNMSKHGAGDSGLASSLFVGAISDATSAAQESQGAGGDSGDEDGAGAKSNSDPEDGDAENGNDGAGFGAFTRDRENEGDGGHKAEDDSSEAVPRPASTRVAPAPGAADDSQELKRKRKEMLSNMTADEKKDLAKQEAKEKRQKELDASSHRRSTVAAGASPSATVTSPHANTSSTPSSSISSPFAAKGGNKDWQAAFLVDRSRDEEARADKQAAAQIAVAKLHLASSDRHYDAELSHKREQLSFQQMQLTFQQQQMQMQMQMQQAQQSM